MVNEGCGHEHDAPDAGPTKDSKTVNKSKKLPVLPAPAPGGPTPDGGGLLRPPAASCDLTWPLQRLPGEDQADGNLVENATFSWHVLH